MPNADTIRDVENDSNLTTFIPADYTDVGQAAVLSRAYRHKLRYCENAGWLTYKDGVWAASETEAQAFSQKNNGASDAGSRIYAGISKRR